MFPFFSFSFTDSGSRAGGGGKNEARKNYGAVAVLVPYLDTLWLDTQPAAGLALPYCAGTPATSGFASV